MIVPLVTGADDLNDEMAVVSLSVQSGPLRKHVASILLDDNVDCPVGQGDYDLFDWMATIGKQRDRIIDMLDETRCDLKRAKDINERALQQSEEFMMRMNTERAKMISVFATLLNNFKMQYRRALNGEIEDIDDDEIFHMDLVRAAVDEVSEKQSLPKTKKRKKEPIKKKKTDIKTELPESSPLIPESSPPIPESSPMIPESPFKDSVKKEIIPKVEASDDDYLVDAGDTDIDDSDEEIPDSLFLNQTNPSSSPTKAQKRGSVQTLMSIDGATEDPKLVPTDDDDEPSHAAKQLGTDDVTSDTEYDNNSQGETDIDSD